MNDSHINRFIVFYFLQPNKNKDLILRTMGIPPPSTDKYIVEEFLISPRGYKSYITPSWTGIIKTIIWDFKKFNIKNRKSKLPVIILKMFGYNDKTHPTLENIIKTSKGEENTNDYTYYKNDYIWEEPIKEHNKSKKYSPEKEHREIKLLTSGESNQPVKTLKPKIKEKLSKLKNTR